MRQPILIVIITFLSLPLFAQITPGSQWTWMNGDSSGNQIRFGTQCVPAATNIPGGRGSCSTWKDKAGNLWLFGGMGALGYLNDLWKYDIATNQWTWMKGDTTGNVTNNYVAIGVPSASNKPGCRVGAYTWTDLSGNLWLFGGIYEVSYVPLQRNLSDTWKYDPSTNQWTCMSNILGTGWGNPGQYGGANWVDDANNLWFFGGGHFWQNNNIIQDWYFNSIWKYDSAFSKWNIIRGNESSSTNCGYSNCFINPVYGAKGLGDINNDPGSREGCSSWKDKHGNFWMFGGVKGDDYINGLYYKNDVWKYDPTGNIWTWIAGDSTNNPIPVYGTQGIADINNNPSSGIGNSTVDAEGNFWNFGKGGVWKFDTLNLWTWVKGDTAANQAVVYGIKGVAASSNNPGIRSYSGSWVDASDNYWIFFNRDLWKLSNTFGVSTSNASCGNPNGSIIVTASFGTAPYQYSIDGVTFQSSNIFSSLVPATYTITAKDLNGIIRTKNATVGSNIGPLFFLDAGDAVCPYNNGKITVYVQGDATSMQYSLDGITFQSSNVFSNLGGGAYTVYVKDIYGCTGNITITVSSGTPYVNATSYPTTCNNTNGTITAQGSGGTAPLTFSINGITYSSGSYFSGLAAGDYTVYVKDGNGCIGSTIVNVASTPPPVLTATATSASCGLNNGTVTATASGGRAPLQYSINGNYQLGNVFAGLASGNYTVYVYDQNGCIVTTNVTVTGQPVPTLSVTVIDANCLNSDGTITANGSGGTPPFQYSINGIDYQSGNVFTPLPAGSYVIYVKDANSCVTTRSVTVSNQSPPTLTATTTAASCTNDDGIITASASGGAPPISYSINGTDYLSENTFSGLASGDYTVYAKDANSCIATFSITVPPTPDCGLIIYPNPTGGGQITISYNKMRSGNYDLKIISMEGKVVLRKAITSPCNNCDQSYTIDIPHLQAGIYAVESIDPGGSKKIVKLIVSGK